MEKRKAFRLTLSFAFLNTYAIGISWIPVAAAFGLMVRQSGVPFYWAGISGILCPCGSLQMLMFSFAISNVAWGTVLVAAAAISFRHLFYGLSFLERFRRFGASRFYMIYMLCDELYSVYCAAVVPPALDERKVHLTIAFLLQLYWVVLSTLFALLGAAIPLDLTGVDFALTALFMVIFLEMLRSGETRLPAVCAAVCAIGSLLLVGPDSFLIPALLTATAALTLLRRFVERPGKEAADHE